MLTLVTLPPAFGIRNVSPFCLKAEMLLTALGLPFDLQGLGRHSLEEQGEFARRDLEAMTGAVPDQGFLFGEQPNIYDFTLAGMMAGVYDNKPATWVTQMAQEFQGLRDYTERVQQTVGVWGRQ